VELSMAAPQVIAHRVARIARAGARPTAADRKEILRMSSEKMVSFYQGWSALWMHAFVAQVQFATAMSASALGGSGGKRNSLGRPFAELPAVMARILSAGIAPIHTRAVANARRLARRKPGATRRRRKSRT
jgi:hypothetical protein